MSISIQRCETEQADQRETRVVGYIWQENFQEFCPSDTWSPAINVYRLRSRIEVCVDLAGVEPHTIDVRVEPGRLIIRGFRSAPQPTVTTRQTMRILAMEIDHGPFCRTITLPEPTNTLDAQTEYAHGLLWVRLPLLTDD